ncbi:MAG: D-glycerate dehydrogenase [Sneathiella sp.]|uniref:2-hydroxyacid dehydrogenase n=1 Tax=Sneathiella sp. TaxID=1964365 RepID=UPI0030027FD3
MTSKSRLLVTRNFPLDVMARIRGTYDAVTNDDDHPMGMAEILKLSQDVDAILCAGTEAINSELISALPERVKMIATFSVGYDHIDVPAAAVRGIRLSNTPDVLTDATADVALLCLLGAARMAHMSAGTLRAGGWTRWEPNQFLGVHVTGKRLGILGMGRIGQAVARRAQGFDMQIHYHNRRKIEAPGLENAIFHETADSFLPVCDFLSINCPLSAETKYFVNDDSISKMPDRTVIVNTARGGVVEDAALIRALKSGKVAAAGLDVFENEPALNKDYLELDNLFVLPHIGSATVETRNAMGFMCLDNLDAFFAGKSLPNEIKAP